MRRIVVIIICMMVVLTGCGRSKGNTDKNAKDDGYKIYYINNEGTKVVSESYTPTGSTKKELVEEFLEALRKDPKDISYKKALPDDVEVEEYSFNESDQLTLYFDSDYSKLTGIHEVLTRAVIVKTLCQIEGVEYIEFYVSDLPLTLSNEKIVGLMKDSDFIDNTGLETNYYQKAKIIVYFTDESGKVLIPSNEEVTYKGNVTVEQLIMKRLIEGPLEDTQDVMYPTVPEKTVLNSVTTKDGICYVDLNKDFLDKLTTVSDEVAIYSIVNSLVELSDVNKVQFMIDGKTKETFRDSIDFDVLFERNLGLVEGSQ